MNKAREKLLKTTMDEIIGEMDQYNNIIIANKNRIADYEAKISVLNKTLIDIAGGDFVLKTNDGKLDLTQRFLEE